MPDSAAVRLRRRLIRFEQLVFLQQLLLVVILIQFKQFKQFEQQLQQFVLELQFQFEQLIQLQQLGFGGKLRGWGFVL